MSEFVNQWVGGLDLRWAHMEKPLRAAGTRPPDTRALPVDERSLHGTLLGSTRPPRSLADSNAACAGQYPGATGNTDTHHGLNAVDRPPRRTWRAGHRTRATTPDDIRHGETDRATAYKIGRTGTAILACLDNGIHHASRLITSYKVKDSIHGIFCTCIGLFLLSAVTCCSIDDHQNQYGCCRSAQGRASKH